MRTKLIAAIFSFVALITSIATLAQETTSTLSGHVTDSKGAIISGATITLKYEPTGYVSTTQSSNKGTFYVPNLQAGGPYTITVSFVGRKAQKKSDFNLSLGTNNLNFLLIEESASLQEVTVTSKKNNLKTGAGVQIGQYQIRNLPTISRSLQDFTRVTPQSNNNSFMGTNFRYNNVTLDGAINNDAIGFSPSLGGQTNSSGQPGSSTRSNSVSLDAIQDIQVYLAPYDVKIGNVLGGSINAVTRSGTNEVHGSVYGFGRGAFMVGKNNAGDKSKIPSDFSDYQTGFRLGLPIVKNKLFFFTNAEITRRVDPIILGAGSADMKIITEDQAKSIENNMQTKYGVSAGNYGNTSIYASSTKFFNRLDWNIDGKNQLSLRNNTIFSEATNLERDNANFRFGSIDFKQVNNQTSTVAELKSKFSSTVSNSFILGYSSIHDYREPSSNPALPQIQIASNGGTIFLGTDREASVFNMKQKTFEITDNATIVKGNQTFTIGTHNELYDITYGFVNSWNGRVDYGSVTDFINNNPSRVRTNYNYANNSRDYIMSNPPAQFKVNLFSVYGQDEVRLGNLKLTGGIRFDYADMPNKQPLSDKTKNAAVDANFGTTYGYTKPKDIKNDFLGKVQISPRIGFNFDVKGDQSLIVRGGTGIFTGRIPFAWLGYAYYNNGVTYGAYDNRSSSKVFVPGSDPVADAINGNNGEAAFVTKQGVDVNNASGATQVDLIDNNFKMPQAWRSSLAVEYTTANKWKFSVEGIYTKVVNDLKFQQINYVDNPQYYKYDVNKQQPIYTGKKINSLYTNAYLLSNTDQGYRYSITGQVSKTFTSGLSFMTAYTYGRSTDITNGIRNSMESNWQLNQSLSPNSPSLATSNFEIKHRIVATGTYRYNWNKDGKNTTTVSLFFNAASGAPYSFGLVNATINGTGQQQSLVYIPTKDQVATFIPDATQAAAFNDYVDGNKYLSGRRGQFTERNAARTPWNVQADVRISHDYVAKIGNRNHTFTFSLDVINLTNLINQDWGIQYFSPNSFNSTSSVGLKLKSGTGVYDKTTGALIDPQYTWSNPGQPYAIDYFGSRYQMQAGIRYTF